MTGAIPSWQNFGDAELAVAAARGDRQALAGIYDRYADRLYDFCVGMCGDRDAAADCVQEVFCVAATNLSALREPERLRPWLYSIARNQAMRRLRDRYREQASDDLPDAASPEPGPDTMAGQSELAKLVAAAAGGLSDRDRELLELTYRHGLDGPELADALGVTLTNANTMVFRLRKTIERSLGALLVARSAKADRRTCPELAATLQGWDGQFTVLTRKRVARHIESCQTCVQEQRRRVNPAALLSGAPLFIPAPKWLRDETFRRVQLTSASTGLRPSLEHHDPAARAPHDGHVPTGQRNRRVLPLVALVIGIPLSVLGVTMAWLRPFDTAVTTAAVGGTELETAGAKPPAAITRTTTPGPTPTTTPPPAPVTTTRTTGTPTSTAITTTARSTPALTTTTPWSATDTTITTTPTTAPVTTSPTTPSYSSTPTTTPYTPVTTTATVAPYTTTPTTTPYAPITTTPLGTPQYPGPEPLPTPIPTPSSVLPDLPVIH